MVGAGLVLVGAAVLIAAAGVLLLAAGTLALGAGLTVAGAGLLLMGAAFPAVSSGALANSRSTDSLNSIILRSCSRNGRISCCSGCVWSSYGRWRSWHACDGGSIKVC